jgi:hypothetical protein
MSFEICWGFVGDLWADQQEGPRPAVGLQRISDIGLREYSQAAGKGVRKVSRTHQRHKLTNWFRSAGGLQQVDGPLASGALSPAAVSGCLTGC